MKRAVLKFLIFLCCILPLAACAAPADAGSGLPKNEPSRSPQTAVSGTPAPDAPVRGASLEMQMVFSGLGSFDSGIFGNEAGAYGLLSGVQGFSAQFAASRRRNGRYVLCSGYIYYAVCADEKGRLLEFRAELSFL